MTETEGAGKSFRRFSITPGDHVVADRGYPTASGIEHVAESGGYVMIRVNTGPLSFLQAEGQSFRLLEEASARLTPRKRHSTGTVSAGRLN